MIDIVRIVSHSLNRRRATKHLGELPDHLLKDIGLTRGQIPFLERQRPNVDK